MKRFRKGILQLLALSSLLLFIFGIYRRQSVSYERHFILADSQDTNIVTDIRIGTYNVKSLNLGKDLQAFLQDIEPYALDILCLQEVDQNAFRSKRMDMIQEMAKEGGYPYHYFFQSMWIADGYYGLGILSKYPIVAVTSQPLPGTLWMEPRILCEAKIKVSQQVLSVYNTHLSYEDKAIQRKQIKYLKEQIQPNATTLLCGDFNIFHQDFFFIQGLQSINTDKKFKTYDPEGSPDNIYYSTEMIIRKVGLLPTSFSDHHLLYCELQLPLNE